MNNFFKRIITGPDIMPEIEPEQQSYLAEWKKIMIELERQKDEARKPIKIKCCECGKEIGVCSPEREIEWVDHDISHNVHCSNCWNLKKLKE